MMRRRFDISEVECLLVATKLGWAILLLLPIRVFVNPAYAPMADVMPEWAWGVLALGICAVVLVGAMGFSQWVQIVGLALAGMWWGWISGMFFVTNGVPTGIIVYGVMSGAAMYRVFARMSGFAPLKYASRADAIANTTYANVTDGSQPPPACEDEARQ